MFAAIHAAAQGRTTLSAPVAGRVPPARAARAPLRPTARDILARLARGLGDRKTARAPHIGEATVKTHLDRIYDRLGVDTRTGAVGVAKERRPLT
ncbi:response regulator transcription factor [Streptomyces fagopyri]|uniref:response regulator transcription factor n=1 Tax=Streptomyces fagopyri TaxID=2662397 RepID=UPI00389AD0DA